ncbi:unnamed protein product [Chondrus crispus]|uniref:Uncharacterized protein n=1 Tax=Chondrus crispus TaxID=2769 RepID=R7Q7A8_CHOCR|nr:unnamed protein product [Chondrus crispus]CDF34412.1 unnamed protein product [Chondrus crispus]|eukprot:XP_005714231.1 unnamed protein product [Chondrus crispus]
MCGFHNAVARIVVWLGGVAAPEARNRWYTGVAGVGRSG